MSSWWAADSPAWSPPPSWPTRGAGSSCSTRSPSNASAGRRSGRSAACCSSTPPNSAGCAFTTRASWPGRTGWAPRRSTVPRITGRAVGRGVRRLRVRREACLAARAGRALVPGRGLGRAGVATARSGTATRYRASTSRGAPVRVARAVHRPGARRRRAGAGHVQVPAPVDELVVTDGVVDGVRGTVLEPSDVPRAAPSSRTAVGDFALHASAVVVTSGGIGGNFDLVRSQWPARLGTPPSHMVAAFPTSWTDA